MVKKGQAAMEFLMTYGWAIVIVLAAIGALAYFGVLSPNKLLPDRTTFAAPIPNVDNAVINADNSFQIAFINNKGVGITIPTTVTDFSVTSTQCDGAWNMTTSNTGLIANGAGFLLTFACDNPTSGTLGNKFKADVSFSYVNNETTQTLRQTGSVEGKYT